MQCNYLGTKSIGGMAGIPQHVYPDRCAAGPSDYETTEEDRNEYCKNNNFIECPRYKTFVYLNDDKTKKNISHKPKK